MKVVQMYEAGDRCPNCNNSILKKQIIEYYSPSLICKTAATLIFCPHKSCGYEILITGHEIEEDIEEDINENY